jgi:flavodoxin
MDRVLVVFFSRSGNTQRLAYQIADAGRWDSEPIADHTRRSGLVGYLRSSVEAWLGRDVRIDPLRHHLANYDLIVVGTPVWNRSLAPPVRAFLREHRDELPRVAFFATCGVSGAGRVLEQMAALAAQPPVATLIVTERELWANLSGGPTGAIDRFVTEASSALPGAQAVRPERTVDASLSPEPL